MMKLIKRFIALLLVISFLPLALTACVLEEFVPDFLMPDEADMYAEVRDTVMVSVLDGLNYKVTSKNPLRVTRGADARFKVELDFGFDYVSSIEGATYENGILTVKNAQKPTSVSITLRRGDIVIPPGHNWALDISSNETHHWYSCDDEACDELLSYEPHSGGMATYYERAVCDVCGVEYGETIPIPEFETVTVKASMPKEGYKFLCWTIDVPLTEGGEVFSEKSEGTFDIPFESTPVENYVDTGHHVVMYRCNGGKTKDGADFLYHTFSNKYYEMPNTIHQNGTFVRDGYTLVRYADNPDGSGRYATLGGKIEVGETGFRELYLIWQRNTVNGLEYAVKTDTDGSRYASVKGYSGNSDVVTIPDTYTYVRSDGELETLAVKHISSLAFEEKEIKSVSIPKSVVWIDENAFSGCGQLKTLTVHDSLTDASDASFMGCPIEKIYLNASRGPITPGTPAMTVLKYERLRMAAMRGEKKILVISGSSSLHGFFAEEMQAAFNGEYTVINYGTNAAANTFVYLYAFMDFFGEGDIVIHAPEMNSGNPLGDSKIHAYTFRYAECMLDIFSYIDMTRFTGFFDALVEFNNTLRIKGGVPVAEYSYEAGSKNTLNEYCDLIRKPLTKPYETENRGKSKIFSLNAITEARTANMNLISSMLNERGATMYYSFAPVCDACIHPDYATADAISAYVEKLDEMIDFKIISDPGNYILPEALFYDSDYHPDPTGASLRTSRLTADLKAALSEEGE